MTKVFLQDEEMLDTSELSNYLSIPTYKLKYWRCQNIGPKYEFGSRSAEYPLLYPKSTASPSEWKYYNAYKDRKRIARKRLVLYKGINIIHWLLSNWEDLVPIKSPYFKHLQKLSLRLHCYEARRCKSLIYQLCLSKEGTELCSKIQQSFVNL